MRGRFTDSVKSGDVEPELGLRERVSGEPGGGGDVVCLAGARPWPGPCHTQALLKPEPGLAQTKPGLGLDETLAWPRPDPGLAWAWPTPDPSQT